MTEMSLSDFNNSRQKPSSAFKVSSSRTRGVLTAVLAVALLGGGFAGGVVYQKGKTPAASAATGLTMSGQNGRSFTGGGFQRGDRAIGTVSAVSSTSITLQTRQGTSSTYAITSSTTVTNNGQTGSVSDIQTGDTVLLTLDSSDTQDVSSIMLNPSFGGGFNGGPTAPSGSTQDSTTNDTTQTTQGV